MATEVLMPRQGNTVESCIILTWKKKEGEAVERGEVLCEVETDKATFEVEAPAAGTLLAVLYPEGADVPVLKLIAVIGERGEEIGGLLEKGEAGGASAGGAAGRESSDGRAAAQAVAKPAEAEAVEASRRPSAEAAASARPDAAAGAGTEGPVRISPRARRLAEAKGLAVGGLAGSGPGGRIIERDVRSALASRPLLTPAARAAAGAAGGVVPAAGSGLGGRVTSADVAAARAAGAGAVAAGRPAGTAAGGASGGPARELPVQGIRKRIAERMHASLASTAQVTLAMSADARAILAYRERLKSSGGTRNLESINLNAIVLYAVAHTLPAYPDLNAHFLGDRILQFDRVHLGFAVDTPRGLVVPVIREADRLSLKALSEEARRLAAACIEGTVTAEELAGGTFTVSNLGTLGIEYFTPVLNPPQVGILGVGAVAPRPVEAGGDYLFVPHIGLSLTIDHQAVDGAPGARFLRALAESIASFDLLLAE